MDNLFSKEDQSRIEKEGGVYAQAHTAWSPEEVEKAVSLVRELISGDSDGFFLAVRKSPEGADHTKMEGMARVHNVSRSELIRTTMRSFNVDANALARSLLLDKFDNED